AEDHPHRLSDRQGREDRVRGARLPDNGRDSGGDWTMTVVGPLEIRTFTAPGFGQNAYLVRSRDGKGVVAVDPGGGAAGMAAAIEADGLRLEAVLLTHAHVDHIEGVAELVRRYGAPVYLHPADTPLYERAAEQAAFFGMHVAPPPPV